MIRRVLDGMYRVSNTLAALCVLGIFCVMLLGALGRSTGFLFKGADDIIGWLCAASAFFALAATFRSGGMVRVGFVIDALGVRSRRYTELSTLAIAALFAAYMLFAAVQFVYNSWQFGEMAPGLLRVPIWIPQLSFVLGVAFLLVAILDELAIVVSGGKPTYVIEEEARRAAGDFSNST